MCCSHCFWYICQIQTPDCSTRSLAISALAALPLFGRPGSSFVTVLPTIPFDRTTSLILPGTSVTFPLFFCCATMMSGRVSVYSFEGSSALHTTHEDGFTSCIGPVVVPT